jgi:nicotinamidase-related amidase
LNDTALLAIDLQRDFLEENGRMPVGKNGAELVIASASRLLKYAESVGWLQVFIKNEYRKADWIGNLFRRGAAIEGSAGAEIDPRIPFRAGALVVSKARPDAFTNPALAEILTSAGIHHLVVLGVMAEGCVRATANSAIRRGFSVTVVSDGVASSRDFLRRFGLRSVQKAGARIRRTSEILG